MKVDQARVSNGIKTFKENYLKRFCLCDCVTPQEPIVMFGMYNNDDYNFYINYKAPVIVVWCGTDSLKLNFEKAYRIKSRKAIHIAKSKFISTDLSKYNIFHKILPVSWQVPKVNPIARGSSIFHYYGNDKRSDFYGSQYIPEIIKKTGLKVIQSQFDTYNKEELKDVYKDCFIGLRLTKHDGVPNTVVELGLMGRKCIYNGDTPNAIPYKNIDDICNSIVEEYKRREQDDTILIAEQIRDFIDIGNDWLNI
jgi:hypothetical protein